MSSFQSPFFKRSKNRSIFYFCVLTPFSTPFHDKTWRGVRTRTHKYTVIGDIHGGKPWECFDLVNDPHEMNNLLNDSSCEVLVGSLHQLLRDELVRTKDDYVLDSAFGIKGLNLWEEKGETVSP